MLIISCPKCAQNLSESDYNLDTLIAQCGLCQTTFRIDAEDAITRDKSYKNVDKPEGIILSTSENKTRIIILHRHFKRYKMLLIIGSILFLIILKLNFFSAGITINANNLTLFLPFIFPFLLLYWGLATMLRKTTITITENIINFQSGSPISFKSKSWYSKKELVNQFFVKRRKIESENSSSIVFDLVAEHGGAQTTVLISDFKKPKPLYYIETHIEKLLNIEDVTHKQEAKDASFLPQNLSEVLTLAKNIYETQKKNK